MFREIRRKDRALSEAEAREILERGTDGVLACAGDDGYPYAVPLNYVYKEGKLFLHCAREGHKIDALRRSDKVSFCVVEKRDILPEKYTTAYRSAIVFGRARIVTEDAELIPFLDALAEKLTGDTAENRMAYIRRGFRHAAVIEITPEHITGKGRK